MVEVGASDADDPPEPPQAVKDRAAVTDKHNNEFFKNTDMINRCNALLKAKIKMILA